MANVNTIGRDVSVKILDYMTFHERTQLWNTSSVWRSDIKIYIKRHYKDLLGECVTILDPSKQDPYKFGPKRYLAIIVKFDADNDRFKCHFTPSGLDKDKKDIAEFKNKWIDFHGGYLSKWTWNRFYPSIPLRRSRLN